MPDKARDERNVALKFLSDCWRAQSSKEEILHQNFSMPNIFNDIISSNRITTVRQHNKNVTVFDSTKGKQFK